MQILHTLLCSLGLGIHCYVHGGTMCVNEQVIVETIELALVRDDNKRQSYVYFYPFNF